MAGIRNRYYEEKAWGDKIRLLSTYGTTALILVNITLFCVVHAYFEPRKNARLRRDIIYGVQEDLLRISNDIKSERNRINEAIIATFPPSIETPFTITSEEVKQPDAVPEKTWFNRRNFSNLVQYSIFQSILTAVLVTVFKVN